MTSCSGAVRCADHPMRGRAAGDEQLPAASLPVQPGFVAHLMQSLCLPVQVPVPTVTLRTYGYQTSVATTCSPLDPDSSKGMSAYDPCAELDGLAVVSDSPASGPILWLRADTGVTSSVGSVSVWRDLSGQGKPPWRLLDACSGSQSPNYTSSRGLGRLSRSMFTGTSSPWTASTSQRVRAALRRFKRRHR